MAGEQLQPYVAALIPRLFRYQHDPNGGVREAMTRIWQALVPDERWDTCSWSRLHPPHAQTALAAACIPCTEKWPCMSDTALPAPRDHKESPLSVEWVGGSSRRLVKIDKGAQLCADDRTLDGQWPRSMCCCCCC